MNALIDTDLRKASASLFGNEKFVEVVLAFGRANGAATAQQISTATTVVHPLVGPVLRRLVDAGALRPLPRATSRGIQYYEVADAALWDAVLHVCVVLAARSSHGGTR